MIFHNIVLNIVFKCNTLLTYSSKNIVRNWHYIRCVLWAWWTLARFLVFGVMAVSYNTEAVMLFDSKGITQLKPDSTW